MLLSTAPPITHTCVTALTMAPPRTHGCPPLDCLLSIMNQTRPL